ncbi:MAG: triose-phosphate isomerase, partial [Angelakisella sp.]
MNKTLRKAVIAGNWKMNKNRAEAKALIGEMIPLVKAANCEVVICVPYTNLETALEATEGTNIKVGAENCHGAANGAFTGEISADMLSEMGVQYVVIGHSERRQYFGETNETVNKRTRAALAAGLKVILCVGELLGEREAGITEEIV